METTDILRLAATFAAFAAAAFAMPMALDRVRRARASSRASHAALEQAGFAARILRNGIAPATTVAQVLSRFPWVAGYFQEVCWLVRHCGHDTDANRAGGVVLAAAAVAIPLGWLASGSPLFGLMLAACLLLGVGIAARQVRERQQEAMRESVPDALRTMAACFRAGFSLSQSFQHIAQEAHGPLRRLFQRAQGDLATGCTAGEALQRMRKDSALPELAFVTVALEIQHQTGGSLQKILDSACDSIEGELALRRALRVQTAQARLSMRIVTIMPFVLMAVFSFVSPDFLTPFFSSAMGLALLALALGMQAAGVFAVRRMLDVKED